MGRDRQTTRHEIKNPLSRFQLAVENLERTRRLALAPDEAFVVETRRSLKRSARSLWWNEFAQFARLPRRMLGRRIRDRRPDAALFSGASEANARRGAVDRASRRASATRIDRPYSPRTSLRMPWMRWKARPSNAFGDPRSDENRVSSRSRLRRGFDAETSAACSPPTSPRAPTAEARGWLGDRARIAVEHGRSWPPRVSPEGAPRSPHAAIAGPAA